MSLKRRFREWFIGETLVILALLALSHPAVDAGWAGEKAERGFLVQLDAGQGFSDVGFLAFDDLFREKRLPLPTSQGQARLRLVKRGSGAGHIDMIRLAGREATALRGAVDKQPLFLLMARDFDILHCPDASVEPGASGESAELGEPGAPGALEFDFPMSGELVLAARVEGPRASEEPFRFPVANLHQELSADSALYRYEPGIEPTRLFAEETIPGTGHPIGATTALVWEEGGRLRARLDFEPDNTLDGEADYASLHVRRGGELRTFTVRQSDRRFGRADFVYTDGVFWRHKVYEFDLSLAELGASPDEALDLAFSAYGTAGPGPYSPALIYGSGNREYLGSYYEIVGSYPDETSLIRTQRFSRSGEVIGVPLNVTSNDATSKTENALVYDANNDRYLALWTQEINSRTYIDRQLVNGDNSLYGSDATVASLYDQRYPAGAFSATSGRFLVAWQEGSASNGQNIRGVMVTAGNAEYSSVFDICAEAYGQEWPSVDYRPHDDSFVVAWSDDRTPSTAGDVYAGLVQADGSLGGIAQAVYNGPGSQYHVHVAHMPESPDGRSLIVWQDSRDSGSTGDDIYGRFVAMGVIPTGDDFPICADAGDQYLPKANYVGNDRFLVTWDDRGYSPNRICGQYVSALGELLGGKRCFSRDVSFGSFDVSGDAAGALLLLYNYAGASGLELKAKPIFPLASASTMLQLLSQ